MRRELTVILAEDDDGHAALIKKNLKRAGIENQILHFKNGQEVLDFLFMKKDGPHRQPNSSYLLLLDIRMPKVDGIEVLRRIKEDDELRKMPVIMVTTTDDPLEVERCHRLGCNSYITKPIDSEKFIQAIKRLGLFIIVVEVPKVNGDSSS